MMINLSKGKLTFKKVIQFLIEANFPIIEARQNHKLSLRKKKIDEMISRRRENSMMISEKKDYEIDPYILEIPQEMIDKVFTDYEDFYSFTRELLTSKNISHIMYAIYLIRSQSIKDKYVHAQYIFENNILSLMEEVLKLNLDNQKIVYETLWCFSNMTFADNWQQIHKFLLKESLILLYHEILKLYSSPSISESVVWLLGNLISNQVEDRDAIIAASFFEKICELLQTDKLHEGFLRNAIWFFSTCFKHYFNDEIRVRRCLNIFLNFIKLDDEEIRTECLNGLAKITEYDDQGIAGTIISSDTCKFIIGLQNKKYIVPSIRTIGNLLTGLNQTTDYLIEIGVIPFLQKFLYHKIANVRKEALWALSNITAGSLSQVKAAINAGVVMNALALTKDSDREVTREALLVVTNVVANSDEETLLYMRELNFIECYIWVLKNYKDPELVLIVLKSILDFHRKGDLDKMTVEDGNKDNTNSNANYFESKGGLEILQMLQFDKSENVYQITTYIITHWYASKTEECKYS